MSRHKGVISNCPATASPTETLRRIGEPIRSGNGCSHLASSTKDVNAKRADALIDW